MFSLQQAVHASPILAEMAAKVRLSKHLLEVVQPHIPAALRSHVQAGPVDDNSWCLLVSNPAVGTKLKLLTPVLLAALRVDGQNIGQLRIKIQKR
ncbi:MAG TPA: DciA family protein [Macromonas sp.]|nr:DciA family protein [Macromonas sp.]